jgi:hypothetical protein
MQIFLSTALNLELGVNSGNDILAIEFDNFMRRKNVSYFIFDDNFSALKII